MFFGLRRKPGPLDPDFYIFDDGEVNSQGMSRRAVFPREAGPEMFLMSGEAVNEKK